MLIDVVPYQPGWAREFQAVAGTLAAAFGDVALRVDHIGSTAVPGLAAKAVIDVQVTVSTLELVPGVVDAMADAGFTFRPDIRRDRPPPWDQGDPSQWEKAYFRTPDGTEPRFHVHVRQAGSPNQRYALLFRDYLRASERAREAYGRFKLLLAGEVGARSRPGGTGPYLDLKDPVFDLIADAAERWAASTGWQVPGQAE